MHSSINSALYNIQYTKLIYNITVVLQINLQQCLIIDLKLSCMYRVSKNLILRDRVCIDIHDIWYTTFSCILFRTLVVNAIALSIMRYQDDINTDHNIKSKGRAAVAQWTKRLTRNGQTRVRIREAHIFDITVFWYYTLV